MKYIEPLEKLPEIDYGKPRIKGYYVPIIEEFMESRLKYAKVKLCERVPSKVYFRLRFYISSRHLPVRILQRNREVYLMRI